MKFTNYILRFFIFSGNNSSFLKQEVEKKQGSIQNQSDMVAGPKNLSLLSDKTRF